MIQIYKWQNNSNGKIYVGQSSDFDHRVDRHIQCAESGCSLSDGCQGTSLLHKAIQKYGVENFDVQVLEEVFDEDADETEDQHILELSSLVPSGYNKKLNSIRRNDEYKEFEAEDDANTGFEIRGGGRTSHAQRMEDIPNWSLNDAFLRKLITVTFPKFKSSKTHAFRAGRWLRVIQLYYRLGYVQERISAEMGLSVNIVKQILNRIKKNVILLASDGTLKVPKEERNGD